MREKEKETDTYTCSRMPGAWLYILLASKMYGGD